MVPVRGVPPFSRTKRTRPALVPPCDPVEARAGRYPGEEEGGGPMILNPDGSGYAKSDKSGNGGNCLETKVVTSRDEA